MVVDKVLTLKEVADHLKLTKRTLYWLTQNGELPGLKVGSSWRFRLRDIDAGIEDQKAEAHRAGGRR